MVTLELVMLSVYAGLWMYSGVLCTVVFLTHTAVIPMSFRFCRTLQHKIIFCNIWNWPPFTDFGNPSKYGIKGARNFYINYDSKVDNVPVKIGVWHILPKSTVKKLENKLDDNEKALETLFNQELATSGKPIVLYCHGNSNSRAARHRIHLYRLLQDVDCHIVAFDYRGYGDSSNVRPTERGVVEDTLSVYGWTVDAARRDGRTPSLFIWGHSLGTGISSHLVGNLSDLCASLLSRDLPAPDGLVLESPFNNICDEITNHPATKLVSWLPYYETAFLSSFTTNPDFRFESDKHLAKNKDLPILILHAKDDNIVPYCLGVKLFEEVSSSRRDGGAAIFLRSYEKREGLRHKWVCNAPDLCTVVRDFMDGRVPENVQTVASMVL